MQLFKLGALTALGALLAMPVMAQGSYQGMPQNQSGSYSGFNQAMNNPNSYQGNYNAPRQGNYAGGFSAPGMTVNQGYMPNRNIPRAGNPPSGNVGPNMYGQNMPQNMPMHMQGRHFHHHLVAHEVHDLRQTLQRAGFTNVRVVPRSFLVRAQDQHGRQVLMIISPHSIEEMMAFTPGGQGQQGMADRGRMAGNYGQTSPGWMSGNQR